MDSRLLDWTELATGTNESQAVLFVAACQAVLFVAACDLRNDNLSGVLDIKRSKAVQIRAEDSPNSSPANHC